MKSSNERSPGVGRPMSVVMLVAAMAWILTPVSSARPELPPDMERAAKAPTVIPPGAVEPAKNDDAALPQATNKYYWLPLHGEIGSQISETPLREALHDAQQLGAATIIIDYSPVPQPDRQPPRTELREELHEMFRSEPIAELFTDDGPIDWAKRPRIVMWVKNAKGNAALPPMACKELYFSSTATMCGPGNESGLFSLEREKAIRVQISLHLGRARQLCIAGGHDSRLVRAMYHGEYALSYRNNEGKVELFEGRPTNGGEVLLSGDDVLTIDAPLAQMLGLSRETVDTRDELLAAMGFDRDAEEWEGRAGTIMNDWDKGVEKARSRLHQLTGEYGEIKVEAPGDHAARHEARKQQRAMLEEMIRLLKGKYGEALSPRWLGENQIPRESDLAMLLEQVRIDQTKDKK